MIISNFTDFDIFLQCEDVSVRYVSDVSKLGKPDLIILPGTKDTLADLRWLKGSGLYGRVLDLGEYSVPIIGICGGYQMLGYTITDKAAGVTESGLGLLSVDTVFNSDSLNKFTEQFSGYVCGSEGVFSGLSGMKISGYEIHEGVTKAEAASMELEFTSHKTGYCRGNIYGTYIHGIFDSAEVAARLIDALAEKKGLKINTENIIDRNSIKEEDYKKLSSLLKENLDIKLLNKMLETADK